MLVSHLLRELESSVREVLRPRRVDTTEEATAAALSDHPVVAALRLLGDEVSRALGLKPAPEADAESEPEKAGTGKEHQRQIGAVLDSPGLPILAACTRAEADYDVHDLLPAALDELGLTFYPVASEAGQEAAARALARHMLADELTPREFTFRIQSATDMSCL